MPAPRAISFVLYGPQMQRLRAEWSAASSPLYGLRHFIMAGALLIGVADLTHLWLEWPSNRMLVYLLVMIASAAFAARAIPFLRERNRSNAYSIEFGFDRIDLTIDGVGESLRWYAVKEAFALPDGYALTRRDHVRRPVLLPKGAVEDGDALWAFLEQRLTGSVPEIRRLGFTAPSRLLNTVDQFLADRAGNATA